MAFSNLLRWQADELYSRIAGAEEIFIIDVRNSDDRVEIPEEITGAHWVPLADLIQSEAQLPRDATIVAYCT